MSDTSLTGSLNLPNGDSITWYPHKFKVLWCDHNTEGTIKVLLKDRAHREYDSVVACIDCLPQAINTLIKVSFIDYPPSPGDSQATIRHYDWGIQVIWCPIHFINYFNDKDTYYLPLPMCGAYKSFGEALNGMRAEYKAIIQANYGFQEHKCTSPEPLFEEIQ